MYRLRRLVWLGVFVVPLMASAQMNSSNYTAPSDTFGGGGSYSSSTNYQVTDTITEAQTPPEEGMASTNYRACAGFQCTAIGDKSITAVVTTSSSACSAATPQSNPMTAPLGTLTTSSVTTSANRICVIVTSSQVGSIAVTVRDANAGLKSSSTPSSVISATSGTLVAGTAGYGICASNALSGFLKIAPYNGVCNTSTGHDVGSLSTSPSSVFTTTGDVTNAVGEILTKAAISPVSAAHSDYVDTVTVIVTGTF